MFSLDASSNFEHLDPEARSALIGLLEKRMVYHAYQGELARLRIEAINNPSPERAHALEEYSATRIKPLRQAMAEQAQQLFPAAINVEALKSMLPMALMALSRSIDLPLVLTALDLDPDAIATVVGAAQEYFREGM